MNAGRGAGWNGHPGRRLGRNLDFRRKCEFPFAATVAAFTVIFDPSAPTCTVAQIATADPATSPPVMQAPGLAKIGASNPRQHTTKSIPLPTFRTSENAQP